MSLNVHADSQPERNVKAIRGFVDENWTSHAEYTCKFLVKRWGETRFSWVL